MQFSVQISAIKNCEMNHTFSVKFRVFEENFSETIWYIGLNFSEITDTVMPFQHSEFLFHQRHQIVISIC